MIGVILINFGGPRSKDEVRPFLTGIFEDVLPKRLKIFAPLLARLREKKSLKMYEQIGGASPVVPRTIWQAQLLAAKLSDNFKTYVGMKYGRPSVGDAISEAREDGCEKIIGLPLFLYQHVSLENPLSPSAKKPADTCGRGLGRGAPPSNSLPRGEGELRKLPHRHPLYIQAMVEIIKSAQPAPDAHFLFSAHAVPLKSSEPYVAQVKESIASIMKFFPNHKHTLAFQSRHWPFGWTGPSVKRALRKIRRDFHPLPRPLPFHQKTGGHARERVTEMTPDLLLIPLGFACENLETLYELDKIYVPFAEKLGFRVSRVPALNGHPLFVDLLARLVLDAAG